MSRERHPRPRPAAGVLLAILLGGCAASRYQPPETTEPPLPVHFAHAKDSGVSGSAAIDERGAELDQAVLASWWETFGSSELDHLVDRALSGNPDLRIANLQVQQAAVRRDSADASGSPEVTLPVTQAAQYPRGQITGVPTQPGSSGVQWSLQGNLQANWSPDVWGEQKATRESAGFQLARAVHQREDVQRNLVAGVATRYIEYLEACDAVRSLRDQIEVSKQLLANAQLALDAHDAVIEDVERNRAALAAQQASLPGLELQRDQAATALAFLAGTTVDSLQLAGTGLDALQQPDPSLALSTRLLLQRPDVRMMEARMLAARADLGAAHARLLPPVSFAAASGFSGTGLAQLLQTQLFFWNAVASITPVIFDGGRREHEVQANHAAYEEMVATYLRTILQAAHEVEDALGNLRANRVRLEAQAVSEASTRHILALDREAFSSGAASTATVLEARRVWQQSHADQLRDRGEYLKAYAGLFLALGAGDTGEAMAAAPAVSLALDGSRFGDPLPVNIDAQSWRVELPGVYAPDTVPAVWRDLRDRFAQRPPGLGLRADVSAKLHAGSVDGEQWYRLSLVNFDDRDAAEQFCQSMRRQQQACEATRGSTRKS